MIITLDIETIGTEDQSVIDEIASSITPPGNISKAETIAAWEKEKKPALVDEVVRKTAFDGGLGKIICIGLAVDDRDPVTYCGREDSIVNCAFDLIKESVAIFYRGGKTEHAPVFVGHNISGFDLRFLWQRAVVNKLKPPSCIPFTAKPWDKSIADTMLMWNPERERKVSLDRLCKLLGVESSKGDMDGSKVWDYYKAGKIAEIAEYCKKDVIATRECYKRMMFL